MKTTAVFAGVACALLSILPVSSLATIYWAPAHDLAPGGYGCAVTAGDIDLDGDFDLTFICGEPIAQCWNVGSPAAPEWEFGTAPFGAVPLCVHQMGDLVDLDSDGDLDLVITCWYDDFVRFYWNTGSPEIPVWEEDLSVFDGVPISGGHASPRLGDMDGDGDMDAMLGSWSGRVRYARNTGTILAPVFEYMGWIEDIPLASGSVPTIALGDVDLDGDLDVIQVTDDTAPQCFENISSSEMPAFVDSPEMLAGIPLPEIDGAFGIELFDVDGDDDADMLISTGLSGGNLLFLNEGTTAVESTSWGVIKSMYR